MAEMTTATIESTSQQSKTNTPTAETAPTIQAEAKASLQYSLASSATSRGPTTTNFIHTIDTKTQDDGSRTLTFTIDKSRATSAVVWKATFEDGAVRRGTLGNLSHSACGLIGDIENKGQFEGVKRVINSDGSVTCTMTVAPSVKDGCISVGGQAINFSLPKPQSSPSATPTVSAITSNGLQYASKQVGADGSVTLKFALSAEQMKESISWKSVDNKGGTIDRRNQQLYSSSTTDYSLKKERSADGSGTLTVTIPATTREISVELSGKRSIFNRSELTKPEPQPVSPPQEPTIAPPIPAPPAPQPSKGESILATSIPAPSPAQTTSSAEIKSATTSSTTTPSNSTVSSISDSKSGSAEVSKQSEFGTGQKVELLHTSKTDQSPASNPASPPQPAIETTPSSKPVLPAQQAESFENSYLVKVLGRPENLLTLNDLLDECLKSTPDTRAAKLAATGEFCARLRERVELARKGGEEAASVKYVSTLDQETHQAQIEKTMGKLGSVLNKVKNADDTITPQLLGVDVLASCRELIPISQNQYAATFPDVVRNLHERIFFTSNPTNLYDLDFALRCKVGKSLPEVLDLVHKYGGQHWTQATSFEFPQIKSRVEKMGIKKQLKLTPDAT